MKKIDENQMVRLFQEGKTVKELCILFECSHPTIVRKLKKYGIKPVRYKGNFKNLKDEKFGFLTVKHRVENNKDSRAVWVCECVCGKLVKCSGKDLRSGHNISCGCKNKGYDGIVPGYFFSTIKCRANNKKREFNIDYKYVCDLFDKQNGLCALTGRKINFSINKVEFEYDRTTTASLDRIDSSKGYIKGNVQWIHKDLQRIKSDYKQEDFFKLCEEVYLWEKEKESSSAARAVSLGDGSIER